MEDFEGDKCERPMNKFFICTKQIYNKGNIFGVVAFDFMGESIGSLTTKQP